MIFETMEKFERSYRSDHMLPLTPVNKTELAEYHAAKDLTRLLKTHKVTTASDHFSAFHFPTTNSSPDYNNR
jgi:hypothetical protein